MTVPLYHEPVLCQEAIQYLVTDASGVYVDGTVGGGGHAERICSALRPEGRLVCFDADEDALRVSEERLRGCGIRVSFVHANVAAIAAELHVRGIEGINGLILDLGISSFQIDEPTKGFSYRSGSRLDMRFDRRQRFSAWDVVNTYSEAELERVIRDYGEERAARRIARAIANRRPLETTGDLASAIEAGGERRHRTKTVARVFQAVRIEVNAELSNLGRALSDGAALLLPGGRLVVISYHSLEDRIVKTFFREQSAEVVPSGHKYLPDRPREPRLRLLTKKPVIPGEQELGRNPRARSAKLRAAECRPTGEEIQVRQ